MDKKRETGCSVHVLIHVLSRDGQNILGYVDKGVGVIFSKKCHDNHLYNVRLKNHTASLDMRETSLFDFMLSVAFVSFDLFGYVCRSCYKDSVG